MICLGQVAVPANLSNSATLDIRTMLDEMEGEPCVLTRRIRQKRPTAVRAGSPFLRLGARGILAGCSYCLAALQEISQCTTKKLWLLRFAKRP